MNNLNITSIRNADSKSLTCSFNVIVLTSSDFVRALFQQTLIDFHADNSINIFGQLDDSENTKKKKRTHKKSIQSQSSYNEFFCNSTRGNNLIITLARTLFCVNQIYSYCENNQGEQCLNLRFGAR